MLFTDHGTVGIPRRSPLAFHHSVVHSETQVHAAVVFDIWKRIENRDTPFGKLNDAIDFLNRIRIVVSGSEQEVAAKTVRGILLPIPKVSRRLSQSKLRK